LGSNGKPSATAYDAAIAVATAAEKERLQALRLRFNIAADSPEWQFYAVLAPLVDAGRADTTEKSLSAFAETIERIEQRVDDLAKQPSAVPAIASDLVPQMARLESLLRSGSQQVDPIANVVPFVVVFGLGALVCEALFAALGYGWMMPRVFDRLGMFCLGLSATALVLVYLWLAPIVRGFRQRR
jgi:hypothetical protein